MERVTLSHEQLQQFKQPSPIEVPVAHNMGINNVLGVSKLPHPARLLSGYLPSFELAQTIASRTDGRVVPTVRVFIPKHVSLNVNGLDHERAERQIEDGKRMIQVLGGTIFPEVPLIIEEDQPFTTEAEEVLREVETVIFNKTTNPTDAEDPVKSSIQSVLESGRKRGGEQGAQNALLYAAHHPFGWHDVFHPAIFANIPSDFEINTLPPSERPFFAIRGHIRETLEIQNSPLLTQSEQINLIMNMCGTPQYLPIVDGSGVIQEPLLEDITNIPLREVSSDLQQRFKASGDSKLRENLRRARSDFDRMTSALARGEEAVLFDATMSDLLPIDQ